MAQPNYTAPIEMLYEKLLQFRPDLTFRELADRVTAITTNYADLSFPVATVIAYISLLPDLYADSMKPDMEEVFRFQPAPFTNEQIDLIFEDLAEEDLAGEAVIGYLVDVLREVVEEIRKNIN